MSAPPQRLTDVISVPGRAPVLQIREAALEVIAGADLGARAALEGAPLYVGTASGCGLRLTDTTVSKLHAELRLEGDAVVVRDLGSRNGTRVGGVRIRVAELGHGQTLEIGQTTVRFVVGERRREVPLWPREAFGDVLGRSLVMRALFALADRVARTDATVLLLGETGTGKDLLAGALHEASPRSAGPFIVVDCGAIPASLMEGELFGSARGAFTGASVDRPGALEQAHGGTVFLDEVGELPLELQPKLLRFLEQRQVKRLGEATYRAVDVRVLAATHRPLHRDVEAGRFREDLFYRLAVITLDLPPLRERPEDIPLLVGRFARRLLRRLPDDAITDVVPPGVLEALKGHPWPGNVRELSNHVQRMVALADPHLAPTAPPRAAGGGDAGEVDLDAPFREAKEQAVERFERRYLQRLLERAGGNISQAARVGGVDRAHLYKLLRKYALI
jgi:DNA-binding NtrC family response regulator